MHRLSLLLRALVCLQPGPLVAADSPREIIERAIRAVGGREALVRQHDAALHHRAKVHIKAAAAVEMDADCELFSDSSGRSRLNLVFDLVGSKHEAIILLDGPRSWRKLDDTVTDFTAEEVKDVEASGYRDRVLALLPLLDDPKFTLTALGESKVEGKPVLGIKVALKGQSDVRLYFNRETGLLVKYGYRAKKSGEAAESLHETILSDYREVSIARDAEVSLKADGIDVGADKLLEYLRRQGTDTTRADHIRTLVRQLGDDDFQVREKATRELVELGAAALPYLREAAEDKDPEVARRANHCLKKIGREATSGRLGAAVRLAAARGEPGTAEVLLNLLPGADRELALEIKAALYHLAQKDTAKAVLVRALEDKAPAKRAAAAAVLGKDGGAYLKEPRRRTYGPLPKQPMKTTGYVNEKLEMEIRTEEIEVFNRLEDKLFARP